MKTAQRIRPSPSNISVATGNIEVGTLVESVDVMGYGIPSIALSLTLFSTAWLVLRGARRRNSVFGHAVATYAVTIHLP